MKTFLILAALLCAAALTQAQLANQPAQVPAFHAQPPSKVEVVPAVLTEKQLADQGLTQPVQTASYKAVAKLPSVMYQLPCYCYCDRTHGHTSLHSCFETTHGANCGTCAAEALYAYKMTKQGWSPKMIREGIIRGDWNLMDLQHPEPVN
ncbi:MAG TPA: CYCXC family (seleno)protein [Candidatus Angelobacter sp.]